ncbi:MAG TPA: hypothetical protein PLV19_06080 [Nitrosomonas sp.]|nr:hypothetical protein [Nitrosomonas sp.]HQX13724.1 hypothetical protein [Nitrosomonas sp.]HRB20835.1 hypothetical protein [Nitrosomonas sp.]HRB32403.1 hypothetical protein [Nitrosomonas sp.]HRB45242.1 hypothetical protein [Nitrosomonas sp.]
MDKVDPSILMDEVRLILAEKNTAFSLMRTGIAILAILALPLSIMSLLVATSKYYDVLQVLHFLIPIGILNLALVILSIYLIVRSMMHIHFYDKLLYKIKLKNNNLSELIK